MNNPYEACIASRCRQLLRCVLLCCSMHVCHGTVDLLIHRSGVFMSVPRLVRLMGRKWPALTKLLPTEAGAH